MVLVNRIGPIQIKVTSQRVGIHTPLVVPFVPPPFQIIGGKPNLILLGKGACVCDFVFRDPLESQTCNLLYSQVTNCETDKVPISFSFVSSVIYQRAYSHGEDLTGTRCVYNSSLV